ncbi:unnamed protein product, partial [Mesorhabditis belari]|uniref:Chromo domain-containing protein n=1 Tax=Mesorhabditis belari TaxID=2138241 RepID=A0AAF3FNC6_9BILA
MKRHLRTLISEQEYTVEEIVDHARFDDLYFRKLMYLKNHHAATDEIMGRFVPRIKKGEECSKYVYRTRWAGYRPDEDTWKPEANFWIPDSNGKIEANELLTTDSLSKSTEQWVKKKEKEGSRRKSFAALNGSSSSDDEQPPNRKPLKRNTSKKLHSTSSSSSDKSEDESSQSSDGQPFYFEIPVAETYATMKADERKRKQKELNRIYKNVNGEGVCFGEEMENDTNTSEDSFIEPLQKDPIKLKIRIDPLEKLVTCTPVDRARKQTVDESKIRPKKPSVQNKPQQRIQEATISTIAAGNSRGRKCYQYCT